MKNFGKLSKRKNCRNLYETFLPFVTIYPNYCKNEIIRSVKNSKNMSSDLGGFLLERVLFEPVVEIGFGRAVAIGDKLLC